MRDPFSVPWLNAGRRVGFSIVAALILVFGIFATLKNSTSGISPAKEPHTGSIRNRLLSVDRLPPSMAALLITDQGNLSRNRRKLCRKSSADTLATTAGTGNKQRASAVVIAKIQVMP